jgi:hypothetical protein
LQKFCRICTSRVFVLVNNFKNFLFSEKIRNEIKEFKRESRKEQKAKTAKDENEKKEQTEKSEVLKEFEESQKKFVQLKQTINLKGNLFLFLDDVFFKL